MKKSYLMLAAAAALFAACSGDDLATESPTVAQPTVDDGAVMFEAYATRSNTTRAGQTATIDIAGLKTSGFGVFGYYTDANEYDPQSIPNFMYNQAVTWNSSYWEYTPVKYWPNEYGQNAISDEADKVTFFAYAPYVQVVPSTGKLSDSSDGKDQWGITGMTRNSASGDPQIKYIASFDPAKSVDLLWGVNSDVATWNTNNGNQSLNIGLPWRNIQHPSGPAAAQGTDAQKVKFTFKHATAQLNVQIDHDADISTHADDETGIAAVTKVYVRSLTFTGIATKGSLNLNNDLADKALWLDYNGTADLESGESVTIYDGRKDGKEGALGAIASNEKLLGLNPAIISNDNNSTTGVTKALQNAFVSATPSVPIYVIPTGEAVEVEIVYDIETADGNLSTYLSDGHTTGSSIENRIKKKILFDGESKFENGKSYTINIHLGLNSVKFDAAVTDWVPATADNPWLPANTPKFAANSTSVFTVPYNESSIEGFTIFGLTPTSTVTATPDGTVVTSAPTLSASTVPVEGEITVGNITIATPNDEVIKKQTNVVTITEGTPGSTTTHISLIQEAKPFVNGLTSISPGTSITLSAGSGSGTVGAAQWNAAVVSVKKMQAGSSEWVELSKTATSPTGTQFSYAGNDGSSPTVTLGTAAASGDKFIVTVQVGDAPAHASSEILVP